ncbi:hypothetical protein GWI33_003362 [Rhynchophorus ferrugineus]|uniref:C2 domain-containing protein n=1 Tax=Rhynchophorus ferrugineus TaxID=354439 RepID=A0A834IV02_RHYFE|nr:hypothetical protein GWI33_003362 [Rhynchophorus ferrugineus]
MPGKVKVKIISGKNLPVMDRSSDTTDAYVEIKLGNTTYKTEVCRRTLHPQWNSEWYRFEVDDSELQDEPLQIRLMDHDTYSANDAIGKVYLNLNPLLLPVVGELRDSNFHHEISGWIPVYDTMHGIRGEVNVTVKVELFSDFNRFRQSSCGVHFFYSTSIPVGYQAKIINGFVEELIVDDDPEYQWIDKIRTPRASNEARQTLFFKLSGELQRKIGVKALALGANAVIGYRQCFDLEGESGIVARGIGTAVYIVRAVNVHHVVVESKEEDIENYLNFVGDGNSFSLHPKLPSLKLYRLLPYYKPFSSLDIPLTRKSKYLKSQFYADDSLNITLSNPSLNSNNPNSLKVLLNQEDRRGESVIHRRFQKFKDSQKSLSKKMTALKAKINDSIGEETDEGSPVNTCERRPYQRSASDSSAMAEILARSVMQATSSLSSILEDQTFSQEDDTTHTLEPIMALLDKVELDTSAADDTQSYISSDSSSSGSDYEEYERSNRELDTISNIINNIEQIQRTLVGGNLYKQYSLPSIPTRGFSFSSLDNLDNSQSLTNVEELTTTSDSNKPVKKIEKPLEELQSVKLVKEGQQIIEKYNQNISKTDTEVLNIPEGKDNSLSTGTRVDIIEETNINNENTPSTEIPFINLSTEIDNIQVIAPVSIENVHIEPKKMVKTAMQTMLLEKFNILGTYTPPTSPNIESCTDNKGKFNFDEHIGSKFNSNVCKKSQKQRDTVLGMPFTSLSSLKSMCDCSIQKEGLCYMSDNHLNKPIETLQEKSLRKKRFKFLHGKNEQVKNDKESHTTFLSKMFHLRHENKLIKNVETQTPNELLSSTDFVNIQTQAPLQTDIVQKSPSNIDNLGDNSALSKTKIACITSNRHHNLPAQDKHDPNSEKKDEISPDVVKVPSHSPLKSNNMISLHRRSSDSDLSITPKGNSLTGSDRSVGNTASYLMRANYFRRGQLNQDNFDMLEYPFLTMSKFPSRFIVNIAGSINARSVKLLERISNVEEPESRDTWWSEIRMEIRSHARSLNCNAVLGYTESTSICEDVCVLSACGTAAVIDFACLASDDENMSHVQFVPKTGHERDKFVNNQYRLSYDSPYHKEHPQNICSLTHLPFDGKNVSMKAKFAKCLLCHKARVPEVLVATIEPPDFIPSVGKGCFIEGHVLRHLKDLRGETIAKEISDGLPFLEYELHRLLINKLKIKGMNAIFGLQIRITVGEKMIVGVAAGTAMYVSSLPTPDLPMLVTNKASDEKRAAELQNILHETVKKNKELYQIKDDNLNLKCFSDDESDEEMASLDLSYSFDSRDCYILEMDDPDDAEVVRLLVEDRVPSGFHIVNTEMVPGLGDLEIVKNLQMFTQIYRAKLTPPYNLQSHFTRILQSVYFKLRRMVPCALCDLQFRIALPEPDEVQLYVIGMALGLGKKSKKHVIKPRRQDEELIFNLDEDHPQESPPKHIIRSHPSSLRSRTHRSPSKTKSASLKPGDLCNKGRHGVDITPLSYVPGANIEHYLGNLNFFFIRETTSIREEGGLSGFIHSFVTEVLAIVRSHVTALGVYIKIRDNVL